MGIFVKICGMACREDVEAVVEMQPDALGFIFYPPSPRFVEPARVGEWAGLIPAHIPKVGVFVGESPETVRRMSAEAQLDIIQLHGGVDWEGFTNLEQKLWLVQSPAKGECPMDDPRLEALLIDSFTPDKRGGTGIVQDWRLAADFVQNSSLPVMLAGGLTADNVAESIRQVSPRGVDVSSGVEASPGKKDLSKVAEFIQNARSS